MKEYLKRCLFSLLPVFLVCFMLCIFGPSEVFFSNHSQFEFVFLEFAPWLVLIGCLLSAVISAVLAIFPERIHKTATAVICAIAVAGYVQVMFLNKGLDLMGMNPDGAMIPMSDKVTGILLWAAILALFIVLSLIKEKVIKKIIAFVSILLLGMQLTALISLMVAAEPDTYRRSDENWFLTGKDQLTVSEKDNVIILVLDYFSNQYVEPILAKYPDAFDFLHDFTYYSNDESVYYGTYPSLAHMITGREVDPSLTVHEWTSQIWNDPQTHEFFDLLKKNGYIFNFYTPESIYVRGDNDPKILYGMINNVSNDAASYEIDTAAIVKVMLKMSCYRFFPAVVKNNFYIHNSEFAGTVKFAAYNRYFDNYDFYRALKEVGLEVADRPNTVLMMHLSGMHDCTNDEFCAPKENAGMEETGKGCMVMVEEYLDQLKALGKYDSSTIIITSDHGGPTDPQVIFFYKKPGETHDVSPVNHAPVSHCEVRSTILQAIGEDYSSFGPSIDDIPEDSERERIYYEKMMVPDYPVVPHYEGEKDGNTNVYYAYHYIGSYDALREKLQQGPDEILPMKDSFW